MSTALYEECVLRNSCGKQWGKRNIKLQYVTCEGVIHLGDNAFSYNMKTSSPTSNNTDFRSLNSIFVATIFLE